MRLFIILSFTFICIGCEPELLQGSQSKCIKDLVNNFVDSQTCQHLDDSSKSHLALSMTNCLLSQLGRKTIKCQQFPNCPQLQGESWYTFSDFRNSFTTFYAHIDNLCHFYWNINRSEKADEMIAALMDSAQNTKKTLKANNQNTIQIINLQSDLKNQILVSLSSQEQMRKIINSSSETIEGITKNLETSLNSIHEQIGTHYAVINKILAGINQIIDSLSFIEQLFMSEVTSIKGVLYFVMLILLFILGCFCNERIRKRKNQCIFLMVVNIFLEYACGYIVEIFISIQILRFVILGTILILIFTVNLAKNNNIERIINQKLTTERLKRILAKAINSKLKELQNGANDTNQ